MNKQIGYIINETASKPVSELDIIEKSGKVIAEGIVQEAEETNRNGRIYPRADLAREIAAPRQKELLKTGNMLGEAGHPLSKDLLRQQTIDPTNVAVRFLSFEMDGNKVKARFKGTNNALGETFDADLREGVLPAFSLRALGSVTQTPKGTIVTNLKMITYDYVIYPSHPGAYTSCIVSESGFMTGSELLGNRSIPNNMDATKSFIAPFNNDEALKRIKEQAQRESAIDYITDYSKNYRLIKEFYDLSKASTIDLIDNDHIAITEAGLGTIVLDIEDYIAREISRYH